MATDKKEKPLFRPKNVLHRGNVPQAGINFYLDTSKRVAKCRTCHRPIPKNTRRFVIVVGRGNYISRGDGKGRYNYQRLYFHPKCARAMTNTKTPKVEIRCDYCDSTRTEAYHICLNTEDDGFFTRYDMGYHILCAKHLEPYTLCVLCHTWYLTELLSPALKQTQAQGQLRRIHEGDAVCESCEKRMPVTTARTLIRDKVEFATLQGLRTRLGEGLLTLDEQTLDDLYADNTV